MFTSSGSLWINVTEFTSATKLRIKIKKYFKINQLESTSQLVQLYKRT